MSEPSDVINIVSEVVARGPLDDWKQHRDAAALKY